MDYNDQDIHDKMDIIMQKADSSFCTNSVHFSHIPLYQNIILKHFYFYFSR